MLEVARRGSRAHGHDMTGCMRDAGRLRHEAYFTLDRREMLAFVPAGVGRVLDVGCGAGLFGAAVKADRGAVVWGVEPDESAAEAAESRLDHVICGEFSRGVLPPGILFDCVVFNDVLEHMADPWSALRLARTCLTSSGCVIASIPNVRFFNTLWALVVHGDWTYSGSGVLDISHLRFFTRKGIFRLFDETGYAVRRLEGINPLPMGRKFRVINALALGGIREMRFLQFAVVADGVAVAGPRS